MTSVVVGRLYTSKVDLSTSVLLCLFVQGFSLADEYHLARPRFCVPTPLLCS